MRRMAVLLLLLALAAAPQPANAGPPGDPGGPLALTLRITDGGVPAAGSMWFSQEVDGGHRYGDVQLDSAGVATVHLWSGRVDLNLRGPPPDDRPQGYGQVYLTGDTDLALDLADQPATVPVDLRFQDAETGEPLESLNVVPQMLFGDYLCIGRRAVTMTASSSGSPAQTPPPGEPCDLDWAGPGHLVGHVPPGVLSLRAEEVRYAPCMVAYQAPEQEPCRLHAPVYRALQATEGETTTATIPMLAVPEPDANVEGYLISDVTGKALPRKFAVLRGSGDFATVSIGADMDQDGSYRLRIPAGHYTAVANLCGHDAIAVPFDVVAGQTLRLDLHLPAAGTTQGSTTPTSDSFVGSDGVTTSTSRSSSAGSSYSGSGDPYAQYAYPACDHTPTPTTTSPPGSDGSDEPGEADEPAEPEPATSVQAQLIGSIAVVNFNGGLGPLGGARAPTGTTRTSSHDDATMPTGDGPGFRGFVDGLPWTFAALGVLALAVAVRRKL